jgi:hypothetical protein
MLMEKKNRINFFERFYMKMLQRVFLYSLMLCSLNVFAMEDVQFNSDTCAENIHNLIDKDFLGMSEDMCFRPVVGTILSWCRSIGLTSEQAAQEMSKIESYIPGEQCVDRWHVLCKLSTDHWYVHYLMCALVRSKMNELEGVTGLTVDQVYSNNGENDTQKIVNNVAHTRFYNNVIDQPLIEIILAESLELPDIHCITLNGSDIRPLSLCMSSDSKYLRAIDNEQYVVWNMNTGEKIDLVKIIHQNIEWSTGDPYADDTHAKKHIFGNYAYTFQGKYKVIDEKNNYCATVRDPDFDGCCKTIILCKRPQEASYICQKAFYNSYTQVNTLNELSESAAMKVIEGFPRKNLETLISTRIKQLTPTK